MPPLVRRGSAADADQRPQVPLIWQWASAGGDQFALLSPPVDRDDVFVWNHETDDRRWVVGNVEMYLRWWHTGKIKV